MNITLIVPKTAPFPDWFKKYHILDRKQFNMPSLGLLSIAAYVENQGHNINVIDNSVKELNQEELVKCILKTEPELVGFGTTFATYPEVRISSDLIKKENKDIVTVAGGPQATIYPDRIASHPSIDFVIRNEGEITFSELVEKLGNGGNVYEIKGLSFKKGNGVVHNEQQPFIKDLDGLPFPARHLIDISKYKRRSMYFDVYPLDYIITSRGCPFHCRFCSSSRHIFCGSYNFRSAKNVVDEIELLINEYGTKALCFKEDIFTANKKRVFEICDELKKRKIELSWQCESRVDTISKDLLKKMKSAGCKAIWFGCESGSQKVLDYIGKDITISQIENAFKWCKEFDISTGAAFVVGFPTETVEDVYKTIELAKRIRSNYTWSRVLCTQPRSEIYDEIIEKKYYRAEYEWEGVVAVETPDLSLEKIVELDNKMGAEFAKITIKRALSDMFTRRKAFLKGMKNFIIWAKRQIGLLES